MLITAQPSDVSEVAGKMKSVVLAMEDEIEVKWGTMKDNDMTSKVQTLFLVINQ